MRLVSWIGSNDLNAVKLGSGESGPLCSTLRAQHFSSVHLLNYHPQQDVKRYLKWLDSVVLADTITRHVELKSASDFHAISLACDRLLQELTAASDEPVAILLSPGTPAMQAIWILLGKTRYEVTFFQASREQGVQQIELPFEIAAEYVPQRALPTDDRVKDLAAGIPSTSAAFDHILTRDPTMLEMKARAAVLAEHEVPVLIQGAAGTGKQMLATAIHNASARARQPFVTVKCGTIPPELMDSVLFGQRRASVTSTSADRPGYFQQADGGTIFLDEFTALTPEVQVKLLRVLQKKQIIPVGASKPVEVNVRVLAATDDNLQQAMSEGRIREDLFYRIALGVLNLPRLRDRQGDLNLLADQLLGHISKQFNLEKRKELSVGARKLIQQYPWQGNVRELQATLVRAVMWVNGDTISAPELQQVLFDSDSQSESLLNRDVAEGIDLNAIIDSVVQHYVPLALDAAKGKKSKAAELLGLSSYQTLDNWIKKHKVH